MYAVIQDINGAYITPASGATHEICTYNPSGSLGMPCKTNPTYTGSCGKWYIDFTTPCDAEIGGWRIFWTVDVGGVIAIAKLPYWIADP